MPRRLQIGSYRCRRCDNGTMRRAPGGLTTYYTSTALVQMRCDGVVCGHQELCSWDLTD